MRHHVVTVLTASHAPWARVMAEAVREVHPDAWVGALVLDGPPVEGLEALGAEEAGLGDGELGRRARIYGPQALVSSCKPGVLAAALRRSGGEPVVLLDVDVLVTGPLDPLAALARAHAIALTPHAPFPVAGEEVFLRAGAYNLGVLAVAAGAGEMLAWWDRAVRRDCVFDPERRLLLAQGWLDLMPAAWGAAVLRDRGMNVMGHNLAGRDVEHAQDGLRIDGVPLRAFHFTGFDPARPDRLGPERAETSWVDLDGRPGVARLAAAYAQRLIAAGWTASPAPSRWAVLPSGLPVTPALREACRRGLIVAESEGAGSPPDPFADPSAEDALLAWLAEPEPGLGHPWLARYLVATRVVRRDVRRVFADVPGSHTEAYLRWAAQHLAASDPLWDAVPAPRAC